MVSKKSLEYPIAILSGVTGSGKTSLSIEWALNHPEIEIINSDSLLVYKHFNIGTAKPTLRERKNIPHHLMDIRTPNEPYTLGDFVKDAWELIESIHKKNKRILFVGGTGFYLKGLLYGTWEPLPAQKSFRKKLDVLSNEDLKLKLNQLDPLHSKKIHQNDRYRLVRAIEQIESTGKPITDHQKNLSRKPHEGFHLFVLDRPQEELLKRLKLRTQQMIETGLIEEVQKILQQYPQSRALKSVGYLQTLQYLNKEKPAGRKIQPGIEGLKDEIFLATKQLVKRQRTWFKGEMAAQWFYLERDRKKIFNKLDKIYLFTNK